MSSLSRELVFLILQFLDEEKFKETVHKLEQESGFYFNMKYFEDQVLAGEWEEVERYLHGFTNVHENRYSMKIFFEIRKQKYLEALDKQDRAKAVDILVKDLKVFAQFNEDLYKEITQLLTLDNFRENEQLSKYGDTKSARNIMLMELKKLIEANPLFRDKLTFPSLKPSRLRTLINQSLNWQHQLCKNPRQNPDIKTLFVDHCCGPPPNGARAGPPTPNALMSTGGQKQASFPMSAHGPFQPAASASTIVGWMTNTPAHSAVGPPPALAAPPNPALVNRRPMTPPSSTTTMDYQTAESDHARKRSRSGSQEDAMVASASHQSSSYTVDDLPKKVVRALPQGSAVMSMDFHPQMHTLLLVGTQTGDVAVWDVGHNEKMSERRFKIWDIQSCSISQSALVAQDHKIQVTRVAWSSDAVYSGAAFSQHLVHIYKCGAELVHHLEIDAHVGGVNDLAFAHQNKQLCVITCGDDKTIKVWDAETGQRKFIFEGHEAPVYSICPHHKENIQFIFSTAIDGKIKAWLYDNLGPRVNYDAPGKWCTTMAYSADGTRLFSCGTSKDGESSLVEWNESDGVIKRNYSGFRKRCLGVVQFDTIRNRFLAAGDDFHIKFWDMDSPNIVLTLPADGGLVSSPRIRFNKPGSLLAVTAQENTIKILANAEGARMLCGMANADGARGPPDPVVSKTSGDNGRGASEPRVVDDKTKSWKIVEIPDHMGCRSARLPDNLAASKVSRLIYTNTGGALLALASNAVHKLWKWPRNDRNPTGRATAGVAPQLWQPASGIVMTNNVSDMNPEEPVPCIALSKNDSYVMSASGGKVSLFNMLTFKEMTTFMQPPPAATFLAFHPQDNNIIAIGMDDSSIQIYNVRLDEVKSKLKGHQKRITGLAFSNAALNVLVSSGADAQLCVWSLDGWERRKSKYLINPPPRGLTDTRVQFNNDQYRLLVSHEMLVSVWDVQKLEKLKQWAPGSIPSMTAPISAATYSCDSQLVYVGFCDGSIAVFDAESLRPRCRLSPAVHTPTMVGSAVFPLVIAAHPLEPNQFALGLSDGGVQVIEPLESEGKWGTASLQENGAPSAAGTPGGNSAASQGADQTTR
ncbi:hypothetical protein CBR_g38451 [Chara braunii]|uniref:CTLH domain-containing protein n=1 Tax=Chara braunii TaxID=69332 RepID=A0A388JNM9_CHABU|nr:hypothetical protein CBR_g38451 [Chara braunii]|eukprot:GBG59426.1 hypothetical protein CBR_g38451 [Chara braunii]